MGGEREGKKGEEKRERRESSRRQVRQKKNIPVFREITVPDLVTGSQCADVTKGPSRP